MSERRNDIHGNLNNRGASSGYRSARYPQGYGPADRSGNNASARTAQPRPIHQRQTQQRPIQQRPVQQRPAQQRPAQQRQAQQRPIQQMPTQQRQVPQRPAQQRPAQQRQAQQRQVQRQQAYYGRSAEYDDRRRVKDAEREAKNSGVVQNAMPRAKPAWRFQFSSPYF